MDNPSRIPAQPRYDHDEEQKINRKSAVNVRQKNHTSHKTRVTITTPAASGIPDQIIYPLHHLPFSTTTQLQGSVASETGTQASESGCSAQTQKTGTITITETLGLIKEGNECYNRGEFASAIKSFKSVLKARMLRMTKDDDPLVVNMLATIGSIYLRLHQYQPAAESLGKALRMMQQSKIKCETNIDRKMFKIDDCLVRVLNDLGTAKFFQGNYRTSLRCYWGATKIAKAQDGGCNKKELANSLYNIGRISVLQKDYSMALKTLNESLLLQKSLQGEKSVEIVDTLNLIGFVLFSTRFFDRAISTFTEALSIVTSNFGPVHEKVAVSLINVGMVLEIECEYKEALRCFSTAEAVCKKVGVTGKNSIMRTAVRSADDIRRQLSFVEGAKQFPEKKTIRGNSRDSLEPHLDQTETRSKSINLSRVATTNRFTFRDEEKDEMDAYAAFKRRVNSARTSIEYREDQNCEFDNSSIVKEDRDKSVTGSLIEVQSCFVSTAPSLLTGLKLKLR